VHYEAKNKERLEKEREVEEFILGIGGNPKKKFDPQRFRRVEGMVESIH
jgi:hypothetical protein